MHLERARLGNLIVVGQVAIALVVVAASVLLLASLARLSRIDPGFRSRGVWTLQTALPRSKYADAGQATTLYRRLLERLAATPGITAAGAIDPLPFGGQGWSGRVREDSRRTCNGFACESGWLLRTARKSGWA